MSERVKRDAGIAFGDDTAAAQQISGNKNRKRRRRNRTSQGETERLQNNEVSEIAEGELEGDGGVPVVSETSQMNKSSQKHQKKEERRTIKLSSEQIDKSEASQDGKARSRSKRGTKPAFDRDTSHIELVLAKTQEEASKQPEDARDPSKSEIVLRESKRSKGRRERREKKNDKSQKHEKTPKIRHEKSSQKMQSYRRWSVSQPSGGAFIDHDPVLTSDEQHLIVATKHDIHVYATKTSLLVRAIHVSDDSEVIAYAQLPDRSQFVVAGLKSGSLIKFDWTSGKKIWSTTFNGSIRTILPTSSTEMSDGFLMINNVDDGTYNMSSLAMDDKGKQLGRRTLLQQRGMLPSIRSSPMLGITVVCSKDTIFVGRLAEVEADQAAALVWHEISIAGKIACFDAQILPPRQGQNKSTQPIVSVAIGLRSGEIQLFSDVLSDSATQTKDLSNRQLHWHRTAPRTVKFSPDSNYLISGGDETVLVIWQLETNQKQTLPHMATAILNATISQKGSAYTLRLGDNSIIVLSTSDLQPFASVSGLALDASSKTHNLTRYSPPAALHPDYSSRLLLAYSLQSFNPATKPSDKNANMLQTYDLSSQVQINRQALARSLVAKVTTGPNGGSLHEPDVSHLDISHDGKWLVTVDQWTPIDNDLQEMYLSRGDNAQRDQLNECFLRFWTTSSSDSSGSNGLWELNTRIDEPVSASHLNDGKQILALATSPARYMVATADSSRTVKIYSPKARMRSGVAVRDADGNQLYTWSCNLDIPLHEAAAVPAPKSAALAFSEDGSVLAASWASTVSAKPRLHLIDTKSGKIAASLPDIVTGSRSHVQFCGQYLVALSSKLIIYDTVTMQQVWALDVADKYDQGKSRLAVNSRSKIVAVALSQREAKQPSQLLLLDVQAGEKKVKLDESIPSQVQVLLAEKDQGGFVIVDGEGRSMSVAPPGSVQTGLIKLPTTSEKMAVQDGLANVFGEARKAVATLSTGSSAVVGQQRSLEDVLQYESTAFAPDVKDLFNQVALVVAGAA